VTLQEFMRKRVPLLIVTACSALSLISVLLVINTDQKDEVVLDQLNPFGSVEDVTLPMQVVFSHPATQPALSPPLPNRTQ
jgi:hypothetical protein